MVFGVKKVPAAEAKPISVTVSRDRTWRVHLRCCLCPILAAILLKYSTTYYSVLKSSDLMLA